MAYTKRDFVLAAYDELGIASSAFDLQASDLESGLRRLDAMMAEWNGRGLRLGYPIPASPGDSSLTESTSVPDSANEAIVANLALRIAPSFGKTPSLLTLGTAKNALNSLMSRSAVPPQRRMPGDVPLGAGHKPGRTVEPFSPAPADSIQTGPEGDLDLY